VLQLKFGGAAGAGALVRPGAARRGATGAASCCRTCCARCRWGGSGWPSAASTRRWKSPGRWRARSASRCIAAGDPGAGHRGAVGRGAGARHNNIRNAFIVAPDALAMVRGQHIGVVDDVMTSGHTLNELAATFKRHGAARVSNLVFARTPPH
jgi:hypothetical protein